MPRSTKRVVRKPPRKAKAATAKRKPTRTPGIRFDGSVEGAPGWMVKRLYGGWSLISSDPAHACAVSNSGVAVTVRNDVLLPRPMFKGAIPAVAMIALLRRAGAL
jgi:hypothetical protein